jgi:choline kinase
MLDARVPPGGWKEEEKRRGEQVDEQIKALIEETRLWRPICSAMWIAWGIMQAKIPGFDPEGTKERVQDAQPDASVAPEEEEDDSHAFDYLGYAQERAMFFWGDCVALGLVKLEELPEKVKTNSKSTLSHFLLILILLGINNIALGTRIASLGHSIHPKAFQLDLNKNC